MSNHPPNAKGDDRINIVERHVFVFECLQMCGLVGGDVGDSMDGMDVSSALTAKK